MGRRYRRRREKRECYLVQCLLSVLCVMYNVSMKRIFIASGLNTSKNTELCTNVQKPCFYHAHKHTPLTAHRTHWEQ